MAKNVNRPAGGIGSKANAPKATAYYPGAAAKGITPGYASQRGEAVGNHTMQGPTNYRGEPMVTSMLAGGDRRLGNAVAASTVCGVGGSRTVMPAGGQGTHGPVNPGQPVPKGELFPGWPAGKGGR